LQPTQPAPALSRVVIDESGEDYLFPAHFFVLAPLPAAAEKAVEEATAPAN
jgi:hypothetical protein